MRTIIKTTVIAIVTTSFIFTSFSAAAFTDKTEKEQTGFTEQTSATQVKQAVSASKEQPIEVSQKTPLEADAKIEKKPYVAENMYDCTEHCHDNLSADDDDGEEDDETTFRFNNRRDGFYVDVSAISSVGDDFALPANESSESEFDVAISYRVQLLGLFMESPGISTRRIQGMYSMPSWGINFYNSDDFSFDLFYQYSTRGIEGLEGIQTRNKDERAGLRITGFFENSQLQAIYSPVSKNKDGSDGIEASISYSYSWQIRNWNVYSNLGVQYRSKEVTPYDLVSYIDDDLSTSAGLSYSAEVGVEYPLTTDWVVGGFVGYNALSDRTVVSRTDNVEDGYRAGVLLTYVF